MSACSPPGAIAAVLATAAGGTELHAAARRALELELQDARYDAKRARRQYDAVEPEDRLVAGDAGGALECGPRARVQKVEQRPMTLATQNERVVPDRGTLLALAEAFQQEARRCRFHRSHTIEPEQRVCHRRRTAPRALRGPAAAG
jgi:hypothetical protein